MTASVSNDLMRMRLHYFQDGGHRREVHICANEFTMHRVEIHVNFTNKCTVYQRLTLYYYARTLLNFSTSPFP